jgi:flagellar protein FliO/FliZ
MLALVIRLAFSLAVVVGLLILLARLGARKFRGSAGSLVRVVHRQPLSRTSAVAVVTVGTRVLVLGTTEQQVSVLTELDPDELEFELPAEDETDEDGTTPPAIAALSGSVLSAQTWKQAYKAATAGLSVTARPRGNPRGNTATEDQKAS